MLAGEDRDFKEITLVGCVDGEMVLLVLRGKAEWREVGGRRASIGWVPLNRLQITGGNYAQNMAATGTGQSMTFYCKSERKPAPVDRGGKSTAAYQRARRRKLKLKAAEC